MYALTLIAVFALGSIIGSFLNVLVLRLGTGIGVLKSSFCFSCGKRLKPYELIPILSFLIQKGHCRSCRGRVSLQYPLIESLSGLAFLFVWIHETGNSSFFELFILGDGITEILVRLLLYWAIGSVLIVIAVYDMRHKIIPNRFVYTFNILALFNLFGVWALGFVGLQSLFNYLIAGLVFFVLFAALWFFSRGTWMGFGDAKLALGIGWLLGLSSGAAAIVLSFWIGAIISVSFIFFGKFTKLFSSAKKLTIKSEIPFAPFLILGTFFAYFFDITFFDIAQVFIIG